MFIDIILINLKEGSWSVTKNVHYIQTTSRNGIRINSQDKYTRINIVKKMQNWNLTDFIF